MVYSFCESSTGLGPWHIRRLTKAGRKPGGGIDTPSLCGSVRPRGDRGGWGGWDIKVIDPLGVVPAPVLCRKCVACIRRTKKGGR